MVCYGMVWPWQSANGLVWLCKYVNVCSEHHELVFVWGYHRLAVGLDSQLASAGMRCRSLARTVSPLSAATSASSKGQPSLSSFLTSRTGVPGCRKAGCSALSELAVVEAFLL